MYNACVHILTLIIFSVELDWGSQDPQYPRLPTPMCSGKLTHLSDIYIDLLWRLDSEGAWYNRQMVFNKRVTHFHFIYRPV
jgi:hypothetical protein